MYNFFLSAQEKKDNFFEKMIGESVVNKVSLKTLYFIKVVLRKLQVS